ncbi:hypothetical protein BROUX41_004738 [Berkeleyomyces rouxiae]|uniref:uncharacterized protein n=1 Tax=Berkeleyomyces rouxiae TaxID=2035830 RepID=UPI003B7DB030
MSAPQKLRLYSETTFECPSPHDSPSTCPTLDLSATLDADNRNVLVYRPNGEQVCKMQQGARFGGSTVTATRWKPNGQFIAVAWKDGVVRLMNLETSKSAHSIQVLPKGSQGEIHYLAWATARIPLGRENGSGDKDGGSQRTNEVGEAVANLPQHIMFLETDISLPKLSPLPTISAGSGEDSLVFTLRSGMDFMFQPFDLQDADSISVMLSGLSGGEVHLSINDSLPISSFSYAPGEPPGKRQLIHHTSHPLVTTHALFFKNCEDKGETIEMVPFDMQFIESSSINLSLLSSKLTTLHKLLRYIRQTTLHINVEYTNARELPTRFLNSAKQSLEEDEHGQHDIVTAFYHVTLTGNVPPKMKEWLVDSMGDRGLKRWAKAATGGLKGIRTLVQQYFIPALERMAIILSRLKGLAQFHSDNEDVGLSVLEIENILGIVSCLLLVANRIMIFSMEELACFNMFNSWMAVTLDKLLSPSTANEVTEKEVSIQHNKVLLYIVEYLQESPIKHHINTDAGDGALDHHLLDRSNKSMINVFTDIVEETAVSEEPSEEHKPLIHLGHLVGMLDRSIRRVLDGVAAAQRRSVRFGEVVRMDLGNAISKMDSRMAAKKRNAPVIYTALTTDKDTHKIVFYRTTFTVVGAISNTPKTQTSTLSLDPGRVVDMKFLNDDVLLALIDPQNNAPYAIYTITLDSLVWNPTSSSSSDIDIPPPLLLPADFVPVAMEVFDKSDIRNQLPARVCLLSKNRLTWKTFALEMVA